GEAINRSRRARSCSVSDATSGRMSSAVRALGIDCILAVPLHDAKRGTTRRPGRSRLLFLHRLANDLHGRRVKSDICPNEVEEVGTANVLQADGRASLDLAI